MAKDIKIIEDLGSNEVELLRLQVNRLTTMVDALKAAADGAADGNSFRVAVVALTEADDFENILLHNTRPPAPKAA